ncbi:MULTISPECIES: LytTR family DNA-binding domain-containing protein [unclassified Flavobacterium]|uniref:LytR/AlgR family response regulator transcription factor n=1 Tax=unclassified Flavobacterium TaxID=196869 RepID=UPI001F14825C|nr:MULTISPECIES: LytTR family DNA-binding domain-containing protein [unclassified Flavobacterium]UMY66944.1 response regulator transcription factor [Flavobacterium sp. HJ-32-4]
MKPQPHLLIIDDDDMHLAMLEEKLEALGFKNIIKAQGYDNAVKAWTDTDPDIVLIDYYLDKGKTGLDFVEEYLLNANVPVIILSTFYNDTVFDQIMKVKPMEFLSKGCSGFELRKAIDLVTAKYEADVQQNAVKDFFFIKVGRLIRKVEVEKIEIIQVDGKYLNVWFDGRQFPFRSTLHQFVRKLPPHFAQVHQSYVVNMKFIDAIDLEENVIYLKSTKAYISRSFRKSFLDRYYHL